MARSNGAYYTGKLKLDRITGIRPDKTSKATPINDLVKPNQKLREVPKSIKTSPGIKNGNKY